MADLATGVVRDMTYDLSRKSRPIVIVPHQERWEGEFGEIARNIENLAEGALVRVDHIGSIAVPGLGAKNVSTSSSGGRRRIRSCGSCISASPESIDGYLFVKEPALHLIHEAAHRWAD